MTDPFSDDEALSAPKARGPYARPGDGESTYMWAGQEFPRVTDILGSAPGQHLMSWYAEVGAMKAAYFLGAAGLVTPDDSEAGAKLEKYIDSRAIRQDLAEHPEIALAMAADWADNTKEPERYRDHRARIGSLGHHALYDHALGLRVAKADEIDYLIGKSRELVLFSDATIERYDALGVELTSLEEDLAYHALPYWHSGLAFIDKFKPEMTGIGLEAPVFNGTEIWAGTDDWFAAVSRANWESAGYKWEASGSKLLLAGDWKTGGKSRSHRVQIATYARAEFIGVINDHTTEPVPDVDGCAIVYLHDDGRPADVHWFLGRDKIDHFYDCFCGLLAYYRGVRNLSRPDRARKYAPPRKGERTCPIL